MQKGLFLFLIAIVGVVIAALAALSFYRGSPSRESGGTAVNPPHYAVNFTKSTDDLLNFPEAQASPEVRRAHGEKVIAQAVVASSIEVKDCKPSPKIARIDKKDSILVKNTGASARTITLQTGQTYQIPARGQITMPLQKYGLGIVPYGCDSATGAVGALVISNL